MRRDSSILPRSSRFRKMFRAGGHVPAHTVAPAAARALAMAKPYPPSSATPATNARLPRRSIASIALPLDEEPRRHRNQLRVPHERVREDPPQRSLLLADRVRGARERVEELVIQVLERPLESIVLEVIVPEELHPFGMIRRQPARARVSGPDRPRRDATGEPPGLHGVHDAAPGQRIDHVGGVARYQDAIG